MKNNKEIWLKSIESYFNSLLTCVEVISTKKLENYGIGKPLIDIKILNSIIKVITQGKLFQRCMHLLYCDVLSLGGNVNTRWNPFT